MQTFSYMQRNIDDKKNIRNFFIFLFLLFYETLTTIYLFLPPLLGVAFWLFLNNKDSKILNLYILIYTLFFEADHSLPFFSTYLFFILLKNIFLKMNKYFLQIFILKVLAVTIFYLTYPIFIFFLHKIFKTDIIIVNLDYFGYILIEIFLALVIG